MSSLNKVITIGKKSREKMLNGVNILATAVGATLGPRGRNVAIEQINGPPLITKDGVTVAQYIFLSDPVENMGAQLVKSVSAYSNVIAGDGTTTATVLAQAFYSEGVKVVDNDNLNPILLKRGIDIGVSKVVGRLKGLSASVSSESAMRSVATISANNDAELGALISSAVATVGDNGIVSVESAAGSDTSLSFTEGLGFDNGFMSEHFIDDKKRMSTVLENCYVIPYNGSIKTLHDASDLINKILEETNGGKPFLLIVKDISKEALSQFVLNRNNNVFTGLVVKSAGFGDSRAAFLEDVALLTGGRVYSDDDGECLSKVNLLELGTAAKVTIGMNRTIIVDGGGSKKDILLEVENIKSRMSDLSIHEHQSDILRNRLARLTGVAGVIRVGGATESEVRERRDRIEDALNAVRSAISEGVVPGGGAGLIHASTVLGEIDLTTLLKEEIVGINIVRKAVEAPFRMILKNSGIDNADEYISRIRSADSPAGFDALRLEFRDNMIDCGIIDPTKVVRSALEHSASASGTLLTTEVSISYSDIE